MRTRFNRHSNFDRSFNRMNRVFWVFFAVVVSLIIAIWITVGVGIYTVVTNPEAAGNIAADVIRPVAEAIKGE